VHETGCRLSSVQVVLVTVPVVVHANLEYHECAVGSEVNRTVGAFPPGTGEATVHE
jgi:hypothetical protein